VDTLRDCLVLYVSLELGCYPDIEHFPLAWVFMEISVVNWGKERGISPSDLCKQYSDGHVVFMPRTNFV